VGDERSALAVTSLGHATIHAHELSFPLFVAAWTAEFGLSTATVGLYLTVGYGLFGAGALPAGALVDRVGPDRVVRVCLAGSTASMAALAAVPGRAGVALGLALWGVSAGLYHPAGMALLSTTVADRGRAFGLHGVAGNLGIGLGPLATAVALGAHDWRPVVAALALPGVAGVALSVWRSRRSERPRSPSASVDGGQPIRTAWASVLRTLLPVLAVVACAGLYYRGAITFLPATLADALRPFVGEGGRLDPGRYAYAGVLLVGVIGQYAGGRLSDRVDPVRGLAGGLTVLAVIAVAFVPALRAGLYPTVIAVAALGAALFALQPLYQVAIADRSAAADRGLAYGFTYLSLFGVGAIGATAAGAALGYADVSVLFGVLAAIAAAGAVLGVAVDRREEESPAGERATDG
jgi:predicted MFS family arabinose efflux permease